MKDGNLWNGGMGNMGNIKSESARGGYCTLVSLSNIRARSLAYAQEV